MNVTRRFRVFVTAGLFLTLISPGGAKYSGGTGEPNDPYQIATDTDLMRLGESPEDYGKHFLLIADIDLAPDLPGRKVFDRAVIAPDTNSVESHFQGTPFTGVFDGNDHTISHLTIAGEGYLGLFGRLERRAEARDIAVVDVNIVGWGDHIGGLVAESSGDVTACYCTGTLRGGAVVGGLLGDNWGRVTGCGSAAAVRGSASVGGLAGRNIGQVRHCHTSGSISADGDSVGGVVGHNWDQLDLSCNSAAVTGGSSVGGLVGRNGAGEYVYGSVTQSYNTGVVNGAGAHVGGLVGYNQEGGVSDCYSTGSVSGGSDVGGGVGYNVDSIANCYATGPVTGDGEAGGLVGYNGYKEWHELIGWGHVTQCFWDTETSGQAVSDGGTGKTTVELQTARTFLDAGWDFVGETANGTKDIWWVDEGKDYPRLWWEARN